MDTIYKTIKKLLPFGKVGLGFFVCLLILSSCRTTRIVEKPVIVERVTHDTLTINDVRRDSIYMHDSIYIHAKGDTIYSDRWHTKYIERMVRYDSIVAQHDTIEVPVTVTTTEIKRERYTPWYAKLFAIFGGICFTALAAYLFNIIRKWW